MKFVKSAAVLILILIAQGISMSAQERPKVRAPEITGGPWVNSAPLSLVALRGRVVFVEFWTYG